MAANFFVVLFPGDWVKTLYRKSFAYKIWKERENLELHSEPDEGKVMNAAKNKLPPGILVINH